MYGYLTKTEAIINDGLLFDVSSQSDLANNASFNMLGIVGNKKVHFSGITVRTNKGKFTIEFFEAPTIISNGTPFTPVNRNRLANVTAQMQVFAGATTSSDGTLLATRVIPDVGGGAHTLGGETSNAGEWVLKPNTAYVVRFTNTSGSTANFNASFLFSEGNF